MNTGKLPPDNTLDDVILKINRYHTKNPTVKTATNVVLKDGPRAYKLATLLEIVNPKTGDFHHFTLNIDHIDKTKSSWDYKAERSVRLDGKSPDEIEKLYNFLGEAYKKELGDAEGELHVITAKYHASLESIKSSIPSIDDDDKLDLVGQMLSKIDNESSNIASFVSIFEGSHKKVIQHIATASRLIEYSKELRELEELVNDPNTEETSFQKHLEKNAWMFGSEYSELLPRRTWTRDDNLDYMLRRTVDGYLEIVEIKTAFKNALFLHDSSHDSYYPSSKLSPVIGQVIRYIEEVERNRDSILVKDKADTLKIRARVIVGRDGNEQHQAALRNFNAHLHQIEIITYDQLIRIARRVLSMFDIDESDEVDSVFEDDFPF